MLAGGSGNSLPTSRAAWESAPISVASPHSPPAISQPFASSGQEFASCAETNAGCQRDPITIPVASRGFRGAFNNLRGYARGARGGSTNVPTQNSRQGARGASGMRMPVPAQATPRAPVSAGACFNCGKLGHIARSCPVAIGTGRVCFSCGGIGHIARVCPSRVTSSSANANANSSSSSSLSRNFPAVSAL